MTILPTNRKDTEAVAVTMSDPLCVAIAQRYGGEQNLYMQVTTGTPSAQTPSMIMCIKTYGQQTIFLHLCTRIQVSILRMDESALNDEEIGIIATALIGDPKARTLGYDLVMGFFTALERGEYILYNMKPRNVMTAWQQYANSAHAMQTRLKEQAEREQRDREYEQHRKQCITLEEYKRRRQTIINQ